MIEKKIIIELVENCSLVKEQSIPNGHGAFGEPEYTTNLYVIIKGKHERVFNDRYIIHNGVEVLSVAYGGITSYLEEFFDSEYEIKQKEKRRKQYLELKKEFE